MTAASVARLESMLRERKLDHTTFPTFERKPADLAETGLAAVDELLAGGFLRGHLSEVVGAASTGRTCLLTSVFAAALARGEVVALVDACDRFDPVSAATAGLDLSSLLWVRGRELSRDLSQTVKRALKAMSLVLDAGGFGVVALDLSDVPVRVLRQVPATTWLRLSRVLEHSRTVGLLLAPEPIARSAEGQTVMLEGVPGVSVVPVGPVDPVDDGAGLAASSARSGGGIAESKAQWTGSHDRSRVLQGLRSRVRVVRTRRPSDAFVTLWAEYQTPEAQ
jgi:recombination protein RecA